MYLISWYQADNANPTDRPTDLRHLTFACAEPTDPARPRAAVEPDPASVAAALYRLFTDPAVTPDGLVVVDDDPLTMGPDRLPTPVRDQAPSWRLTIIDGSTFARMPRPYAAEHLYDLWCIAEGFTTAEELVEDQLARRAGVRRPPLVPDTWVGGTIARPRVGDQLLWPDGRRTPILQVSNEGMWALRVADPTHPDGHRWLLRAEYHIGRLGLRVVGPTGPNPAQ